MFAKKLKLLSVKTEDKDEIREMMISSANYNLATLALPFPDLKTSRPNPKPRTRRRLNDLSREEKIERKKLKNREAAQTSRDKKKAYVNSLEVRIQTLESDNEELTSQVCTLLSEKDELLKKTEMLEKELRQLRERQGSSGSAVPLPLQKETPLRLSAKSTFSLLTILCSIWTTLIGSTTCRIHRISKSSKESPIRFVNRLLNSRKLIRYHRWWGPNQKAWNPIALNLKTLMMIKF